MTMAHPSWRIPKKFKYAISADDTILSSTITVPATRYGVIYRAWLSLDVASEADLEALPAVMHWFIYVGSVLTRLYVHPYVEHTDGHASAYVHREVDLGPWFQDFGEDGFYSGIRGDNIVA